MFQGVVDESNVALDWFPEASGRSWVHIVSHAHMDHLRGLDVDSFQGSIHCSWVTGSLLSIRKNIPSKHLTLHALREPFFLECTYRGTLIRVSCEFVDANHCPGAVMVLLEFPEHTVLYTGDFRYHPNMFGTQSLLRTRSIDVLIFDSTFFHPKVKFPSKEKSAGLLIDLIERKSTETPIFFSCEMLGSEEMLLVAAQHFGEKFFLHDSIHLQPSQRRLQLECLPSLAPFVSENPQSRFVIGSVCRNSCERSDYLCLRPSALFFAQIMIRSKSPESVEPMYVSRDAKFARILFSMHCDYVELRKFINEIAPKKLVPMVLPPGFKDEISFLQLLREHYPSKLSSSLLTSNQLVPKKESCDCSHKSLFVSVCAISNQNDKPCLKFFLSSDIVSGERKTLLEIIFDTGGHCVTSIEKADVVIVDSNLVSAETTISFSMPRIQKDSEIIDKMYLYALRDNQLCILNLQCWNAYDHIIWSPRFQTNAI